MVKREDGEIPSLPRSCEWGRNLHIDHCSLKSWDGKAGESRKIHESENLTSNLKTFRGGDDWIRTVYLTPSPIRSLGFFIPNNAFKTTDSPR